MRKTALFSDAVAENWLRKAEEAKKLFFAFIRKKQSNPEKK